ncbi:MAG: DUF2252 family protein [Nannocystaceae bacterium]
MRRPGPLFAAALLGVTLVAAAPGCDGDDAARSAWLHNALVLDNQVFLENDPGLAAGKFAKMGLGLYPFFRGGAGLYARDLAEAGSPGYLPTAYLSEDAADVALVGDPHLENLGTFRRVDGALIIDFNDYDAATYGPYHFDVRRLAVSVAIAAAVIDEASPGFAEAAAGAPEAVARAYVDEIEALAGGGEIPRALEGAVLGEILDDLVKKALEKGDAREELSDYTRIEGGARVLFFGDVEPALQWSGGPFDHEVISDRVAPVDEAEAAVILAALADYPPTLADPRLMSPEALTVKGLGRRLGAGVASYPVRRYYALVEGPTDALEDDVLLELKQVFDPLMVPGLRQAGGRIYADNGERVCMLQRALQGGGDVDPLLGVARAGDLDLRVHERAKIQRGLDVARMAEKIGEGKWDAAEYLEMSRWAGRLLARAHARAPKRDGEPGLGAIHAGLRGDGDGFVAETAGFVAVYAPVVIDDYRRFGEVLAEYGPGLGYVRR